MKCNWLTQRSVIGEDNYVIIVYLNLNKEKKNYNRYIIKHYLFATRLPLLTTHTWPKLSWRSVCFYCVSHAFHVYF